MNATPVSKRELVRLLVIEHGQKRASELSGEPYEKVRKWTQRGDWLSSQSVPTTSVVDRVSDELATNERATRLSLSRYSKRAAQEAEEAKLKDAGNVHKAAQVAGIAFKWDSKTDQAGNVIVNVALLGVQPEQVAPTVLDVDPGVSE